MLHSSFAPKRGVEEKRNSLPASPKLTIGLPVYNKAPFLINALRSVFAQTACDWELIIVDDGSTDRSLAILGSLHDARVTVLADGNHKGLAARLNEVVACLNTALHDAPRR
jgi:glycosyltransferase involved in cell wall biosynthesis